MSKRTVPSFQIDEDVHYRLVTLSNIHYEGKMSMLMRRLVAIGLEQVELGDEKLGV